MQKLTDIQRQIEVLQKQASEMRAKQFDATVADILATMKAFGISVKDLQAPKGKANTSRKPKGTNAKSIQAKGNRSKVAPKYKGPNGETWSGRGLTPKWLADFVEAGKPKEAFLISIDTASAV